MSAPATPVWFITGCSTGLGRAVALEAVSRGWRLAATARDLSAVQALADAAPDRVLPLELDVARQEQMKNCVRQAEERFGRIDVLLNNAGYGYQAAVEEGAEAEIRAQFEANVFGLFALTREVLPGMRRQRSGRILNVTSVAGLIGFASSGYYAASKHAVEGFSDALAVETAPLGIKVTCIEPGPFRTDWAGRSLRQTPSRIDDYASTAGARQRATAQASGTQAGDPLRAAQAIADVSLEAAPPRHLVLGAFGHAAIVAKLKERLAEIEARREVALAADYPERER